ncbi:hypothetical protein [Haloactinopolyspora sp.]|jgi:hypothetical protein|nr:hypothetical protein [Haloactinopolyspora sp.]
MTTMPEDGDEVPASPQPDTPPEAATTPAEPEPERPAEGGLGGYVPI